MTFNYTPPFDSGPPFISVADVTMWVGERGAPRVLVEGVVSPKLAARFAKRFPSFEILEANDEAASIDGCIPTAAGFDLMRRHIRECFAA